LAIKINVGNPQAVGLRGTQAHASTQRYRQARSKVWTADRLPVNVGQDSLAIGMQGSEYLDELWAIQGHNPRSITYLAPIQTETRQWVWQALPWSHCTCATDPKQRVSPGIPGVALGSQVLDPSLDQLDRDLIEAGNRGPGDESLEQTLMPCSGGDRFSAATGVLGGGGQNLLAGLGWLGQRSAAQHGGLLGRDRPNGFGVVEVQQRPRRNQPGIPLALGGIGLCRCPVALRVLGWHLADWDASLSAFSGLHAFKVGDPGGAAEVCGSHYNKAFYGIKLRLIVSCLLILVPGRGRVILTNVLGLNLRGSR
jgi:hypothetical protein